MCIRPSNGQEAEEFPLARGGVVIWQSAVNLTAEYFTLRERTEILNSGEATMGLLFRRLWAARSPAEELEPLEFEAGKEEGSEFQVSALA